MPSCRHTVSILLMMLCLLTRNAQAAMENHCPPAAESTKLRLPFHIYLPPLSSNGPYNIQNPGRIAEAHLVIIRNTIENALCAVQSQRVPLASLRFTVHARTDEVGARAHILQQLQKQAGRNAHLQQLGRSIVDVVAAWHRARIVAEQIQIELARALIEAHSLEAVEPTAMVEPAELTSDGPGASVLAEGEPSPLPPRSFVITVASRAHPIFSAQPGNASFLGPSAINVPCCNGCIENKEYTALSAKIPHHQIPVGMPAIESLFGVAFGTLPDTRDFLYRELAWLILGIRQPIHRFEFGIRINLHAGEHGVKFNDIEQQQQRLGLGATARVGVSALRSSSVQITAGLEGGLLYLFRRIEQTDYPYIGSVYTEHVLAPHAELWLRTDVPLPIRRLSFSGEAKLGFLPITTKTSTNVTTTVENLTVTLLGGFSYALR